MYKTGSVPLAAFIIAKGIPLAKTNETRSNHCDFFFDDLHAEQLADQYYAGGTIEAAKFFDALQVVRRTLASALGVER